MSLFPVPPTSVSAVQRDQCFSLPCCGLLWTRLSFISDPQPCSNRAEKHPFCPVSSFFFFFFATATFKFMACQRRLSKLHATVTFQCLYSFFFFKETCSKCLEISPSWCWVGKKTKRKALHIIFKTSLRTSHPYLGVGISTWCHLCLRITYVRPTRRGGERGRRAELPNSLQSLHEFPSALVWTPATRVTLARPRRCLLLRAEALPDCCLHRFHLGGFLQKQQNLQEPNGTV